MEFGEARRPVGDVAERRSGRKAEGNLAVLEDDPQLRLARSRLMISAHFGLLWSYRRATPRSHAAMNIIFGVANAYDTVRPRMLSSNSQWREARKLPIPSGGC